MTVSSRRPSQPSPPLWKQFSNFTNNSPSGLEKLLRLLQALAQIVSEVSMLSSPGLAGRCAVAKTQLALGMYITYCIQYHIDCQSGPDRHDSTLRTLIFYLVLICYVSMSISFLQRADISASSSLSTRLSTLLLLCLCLCPRPRPMTLLQLAAAAAAAMIPGPGLSGDPSRLQNGLVSGCISCWRI